MSPPPPCSPSHRRRCRRCPGRSIRPFPKNITTTATATATTTTTTTLKFAATPLVLTPFIRPCPNKHNNNNNVYNNDNNTYDEAINMMIVVVIVIVFISIIFIVLEGHLHPRAVHVGERLGAVDQLGDLSQAHLLRALAFVYAYIYIYISIHI